MTLTEIVPYLDGFISDRKILESQKQRDVGQTLSKIFDGGRAYADGFFQMKLIVFVSDDLEDWKNNHWVRREKHRD